MHKMKALLLSLTLVFLCLCLLSGCFGTKPDTASGESPYANESYRKLDEDNEDDLAIIVSAFYSDDSNKNYQSVQEKGSLRATLKTTSYWADEDEPDSYEAAQESTYDFAFSENGGFYIYDDSKYSGSGVYSNYTQRCLLYGENENGAVHYRRYYHTVYDGEESYTGENKLTTTDPARQSFDNTVGQYMKYSAYSCTNSSIYQYDYTESFYEGENTFKVEIKGIFPEDGNRDNSAKIDFVYICDKAGLTLYIKSSVEEYEKTEAGKTILTHKETVEMNVEYGVTVTKLDKESFGFTGTEETNISVAPSPSE